MAKSEFPYSKSLREVDELIGFVQKVSPNILRPLARATDRASLVYRVLVSESRSRSDDEIMSVSGMDPRTHQRAISELKALLLRSLLNLDLKAADYDELAQRLYAHTLQRARVAILEYFGPQFSAEAEARQAYEEAISLELWDSANSLFPILERCAAEAGDVVEMDSLIAARKRVEERRALYLDASELWLHVFALVRSAKGQAREQALPSVLSAIAWLEPKVSEFGTFRLSELLFKFRVLHRELTMDYEGAYEVNTWMENLLETYPLFVTSVRRAYIRSQRLRLALRSGWYSRAESLISESSLFVTEGDEFWYSFKDLEFTYMMHLRRYEDAFRLVRQVEECRGFHARSDREHDDWKMHRLFAECLTGRQISAAFDVKAARAGDIARSLLAEFPSYRHDYSGHHFSAIILEVLICLESRHGRMYLIDRIESLVKFRNRHLKGQGTSQAAQFIEMLRLILKHDFNRQSFLREAESLRQKLDVFDSTDTTRNELVLPYGVLWDEIVERLPNEPWLTD